MRFVSLTALRDPAHVIPTIAQALHLPDHQISSPLDQVKSALRHCRLLLVLDNFEPVVAAAPQLIEMLVACPAMQILVTSREALHVRGERIVPLHPLPLPDPLRLADLEAVASSGSVALFLARAREVMSDLALTHETAPLITTICRRLDGLPLAIELAAARLNMFSLAALAGHLDHRLAVLINGPRDLPTRHQTLRNTLAWSYDLLTQDEQRLFRLFAVFAEGCTLEAVETISGMMGQQRASMPDILTSLLNKHVLTRRIQVHDESRFVMLETVRDYAWECLCDCGEADQAQSAHATYYLHLAEQADRHSGAERHGTEYDLLAQEQGNLQAALRWAVAEESRLEIALRLASAARWWYLTIDLSILERALARSKGIATSVRMNALLATGCIAFLQDNGIVAERLFKVCLKLAHETEDKHVQGVALSWLGWLAWTMHGELQVARSRLEHANKYAQERGDIEVLFCSLFGLGGIVLDQREFEAAQSLMEKGLSYARSWGNEKYQIWFLHGLGRVYVALGDLTIAWSLIEESLALAQATHDLLCVASSLDLLGRLALMRGDISTAWTLLSDALAVFRQIDRKRSTAYALIHLERVARQRGEMEAAWNLWQEGWVLFHHIGDVAGQVDCLREWGVMAASQGDEVRAIQIWGKAAALAESRYPHPFCLPIEWIPQESTEYEHALDMLRRQLGASEFNMAWAQGRAMATEQIVAANGSLWVGELTQVPLTSDQKPQTA